MHEGDLTALETADPVSFQKTSLFIDLLQYTFLDRDWYLARKWESKLIESFKEKYPNLTEKNIKKSLSKFILEQLLKEITSRSEAQARSIFRKVAKLQSSDSTPDKPRGNYSGHWKEAPAKLQTSNTGDEVREFFYRRRKLTM